YLKGQKVRTLIKQDFENAFEQCDVVIAPNSPITAFKLGERVSDPIKMYLSDIYTISANLAGIPGISIPCGTSKKNGMPIGLQLMSKHFDEESLITVGHNFQLNTDHHLKQPPL
ncbi:MAG TPA: Asp-tRNA(Asn)/Glu-tRNA(Gln) amidotransferase subunit GatA, partial [Nitrospinaceae bacterium]|nr:Asp-tRNA(Asn)/Glu-tRNA(Gln) amidotransferase subunit GatA [Nitrospinaceae bacterium]